MAGEVKLNDGGKIPGLGFGTWQLAEGSETKDAVTEALEAGYLLIDTAKIYGNEASVGRAVKASHIPRKDIFVTTKLWNSDQGYDSGLRAFEQSLERMGLDYIDLYLIHWPNSAERLDSWRALVEIQRSGRAHHIGVSNYTVRHLQELMEHSDVLPSVNQIEFHPFIYGGQLEVLEFCRAHGIVVEAYSPLARGWKMDDPVLKEVAQAQGRSVAQIMLRWAIQHGTVPIPKATSPERIRENISLFDFELNQEEMAKINALGGGEHLVWDPNQID